MTITKLQRQRAHRAAVLHARLSSAARWSPQLALPEFRWEQLEVDLQQLSRALERDWRSATESQRTCAVRSLRHLVNDLIALQGQLEEQLTIIAPPSSHDIYLDLLALEQEFSPVEWHGRKQRLSVTTEPIELEGVYLGPFRIELFVENIHDAQPYAIVALDPRPAAKDESITHPHVSDGSLCEGEGKAAIRAALRGGRLLDFFQIVSNILHTYNDSGPYVALSDWNGAVCVDCDYTMNDDAYTCSACRATLCSECERSCSGCSDSLCSECSSSCDVCGDTLCSGCTRTCNGCDRGCCASCLQPDERCQDCHAKEEVQSESASAAV